MLPLTTSWGLHLRIASQRQCIFKCLTIANVDSPPRLLGNASTGAAAAGNNEAAKAAAWAERKRTATVCPHCDRKHPNCTHEQCWELQANAAKCPADWKSVKSTWWCKGLSVTTELQVAPKVNTNCTYAANVNYWAPLSIEEENDKETNQVYINNISDAQVQCNLWSMLTAWLYQRGDKHKPFQQKASTMVLDSGATSSFVRPEENLPITGPSNKIVAFPDRSTKQATHTAILPFKSLSDKARRADVLPGLWPNLLVSVGKLADVDYTTIFHPWGEDINLHKKNTFWVQLLRKPVLQGWRDANGLWRLSRDNEKTIIRPSNEVAANVYTLPSMLQTIRYLHAATGFPTKDLWVKAIKSGNYATWTGITIEAVSRHFPESWVGGDSEVAHEEAKAECEIN